MDCWRWAGGAERAGGLTLTATLGSVSQQLAQRPQFVPQGNFNSPVWQESRRSSVCRRRTSRVLGRNH